MSDIPDPGDDRNQVFDRQRLRELVYSSVSCEFSSVRNGKPATFPVTPFYDADRESVVISSPPAFAGKVENVKHDSRVSVLLRDSTGEYLLSGEATVRDDDFEANGAYLRELIESEPATHKRAVFEETTDWLDSWLGRAVMGWYGLRIIVEIDPVSVTQVSEAVSIEELPAWPAIGMNRSEAGQYDRAVLSTVQEGEYPGMWPVSAVRLREDGATIESTMSTTPPDGHPACLLLHWHDDRLQHLGQRVIRGRFRPDSGSHRFVPGSCSTLSNDGLLDSLRFVMEGKRRTRAYFRENR